MTCTTARNHAVRHDYAPPTSAHDKAHSIADVLGTVIGLGLFVLAVLAVLRWVS